MIKYQTSLYSILLLHYVYYNFKSLFHIHTPTIWLINNLHSHWVKIQITANKKLKSVVFVSLKRQRFICFILDKKRFSKGCWSHIAVVDTNAYTSGPPERLSMQNHPWELDADWKVWIIRTSKSRNNQTNMLPPQLYRK